MPVVHRLFIVTEGAKDIKKGIMDGSHYAGKRPI